MGVFSPRRTSRKEILLSGTAAAEGDDKVEEDEAEFMVRIPASETDTAGDDEDTDAAGEEEEEEEDGAGGEASVSTTNPSIPDHPGDDRHPVDRKRDDVQRDGKRKRT